MYYYNILKEYECIVIRIFLSGKVYCIHFPPEHLWKFYLCWMMSVTFAHNTDKKRHLVIKYSSLFSSREALLYLRSLWLHVLLGLHLFTCVIWEKKSEAQWSLAIAITQFFAKILRFTLKRRGTNLYLNEYKCLLLGVFLFLRDILIPFNFGPFFYLKKLYHLK